MNIPTCWYCPKCGRCSSDEPRVWPNHASCMGTMVEVPLLVPGVDLPTLLKEAGYDVLVRDIGEGLTMLVGLPDEKPDWTAGIPMDQWPENQPGYEPGVLPDKKGLVEEFYSGEDS